MASEIDLHPTASSVLPSSVLPSAVLPSAVLPSAVPTPYGNSGFWSAYGFVLLPYSVPALVVLGYLLGGIWNFLAVVVVFGLVPWLDRRSGNDRHNPPEALIKALSEVRLFRWITFVYVPLQALILVLGAYVVTRGTMTPLELFGFTLSMGVMTGGLGITFAHELGHKTNRLEQNLAKSLLVMVCYGHFFIEHNQGHHLNVSTRKDPASSRLGESFYRFLPRTLIGSFLGAWRLEVRRLERSHRALWGVRNQMLWFVALPVLIAALLGGLFGWQAVPFFFAQSFIAFTLLELVNYLEHYGLERRELEPGKYERVNPLHSWNSNRRLTNGFLIMLQRHSDHHANPMRRYQTLRHFAESPQLPSGYATMVLLALVPPLWFRIMNPRVLAFREKLASQG